MPINGVPTDLVTVETDQEDNIESFEPDVGPLNEEDLIYDCDSEMNSFLPVSQPQLQTKEIDAIHEKLSENSEALQWPAISDTPLSEFSTSFLATMSFPCLFPDGLGDPTNPAIEREIPFHEKIKHLLKFAELKEGKFFYHFATHPLLSFTAK